MSFPVHNSTDTSSVASSGDHADISGLKLDSVDDLSGGDVQSNSVVDLDHGIGIPESSAIIGVQVWDVLGPSLDGADAAKLVLCLLIGDSVNCEPESSNSLC
jgi:hypothetical protein